MKTGTTTTKATTKRAVMRQLLNRKQIYRISDYARAVSDKFGCDVLYKYIKTELWRMQAEGIISYTLSEGKFVIGFTI